MVFAACSFGMSRSRKDLKVEKSRSAHCLHGDLVGTGRTKDLAYESRNGGPPVCFLLLCDARRET